MCGRYVAQIDAALEREFRVLRSWSRELVSYNVAPTQEVPVVVSVGGVREGRFMRWGLIPHFAHGQAGPYATINARVETLRTSPAYRGAWQRGQRCLVIASGFYEWQVVAAAKQPWYITCADQPHFAFAGVWDRSTLHDGGVIESVTIVTLPASPFMADIHNTKHREPAILRAEDQETWLTGSADAAFACLKPYPDDLRSAWPVSRRVNAPKNNDAALIDPAAA